MHTKVIVCGGRRAGKDTALRIAQFLHENGIDADVIEGASDISSDMAARVTEILVGCKPPEMVGNRPPPTPNPQCDKAQIPHQALAESVSRLLKKVGKLQAELMDKVGSKNVIIDDVKLLAEVELLKRQLSEKTQQLGVIEEEKQNLVSERDEANEKLVEFEHLKWARERAGSRIKDLQAELSRSAAYYSFRSLTYFFFINRLTLM